MTKIIANCAPTVGLTDTQKNIRDVSSEFVKKFKHLISDPDRLVNSQFKRTFGRDMADITSFSDVELFDNFHVFESKLKTISKQIETGKMTGKLGRWLWTTQELAERNPIMANIYDDFIRTRLNYKGRTGKSDNKFNGILNHLKRASITSSIYNSLGSKGKMDKAVEYASKLEADIELLK